MLRRRFSSSCRCSCAPVSSSVLSAPVRGISSQQRQVNEQDAEMCTQFWHPVSSHKNEPFKEHVAKLRMKNHLLSLIAPNKRTQPLSSSLSSSSSSPIFTWTGIRTSDPQVVEDFLFFLCTGFDLHSVDTSRRIMKIEHSRSFLGWKPKPLQIPSSSSSSISSGDDKKNENVFEVPFSQSFTFSSSEENEQQEQQQGEAAGKSSNFCFFDTCVFDCELQQAISSSCPIPEVVHCLQDPEAIKMVVALRKAGVKPDVISWRALRSATKKTSSWASALGVL